MICQVGYFEYADGIVIPELSTIFPTKENIQRIIDIYSEHNYAMFTNNPLVLDCFDYDSVIVITENGSRYSYKDHPQYKKWKNELSVSEFYCIFRTKFD